MKRFVHIKTSGSKEIVLDDIWYQLQDLMDEGNYTDEKEIYITFEKQDD